MRGWHWLSIIQVCALFCSAQFLYAQAGDAPKTGVLVGTVRFADGTFSADTMVTVTQANGNQLQLRTDQNGVFRTTLPPGELTIVARGIKTTVTLVGGQETAKEIQVPARGQLRDVTLTVRTADGKPDAGATVSASYLADGKIQIRRAITDAKGVIVWKDLPAVRVIVWGPTLPAGVIAVDATTVTTPLPTPIAEGVYSVDFTMTNPGDQPTRISWQMKRPGDRDFGGGYSAESFYNTPQPGEAIRVTQRYNLAAGQLFSFSFFTRTDPPRLYYLQDAYAPYLDDTGDIAYPFTATEAPGGHIRLLTKDGKPSIGVSQFALAPMGEQGLPPILSILAQSAGVFYDPSDNGDGSYTVCVPAPGRYRLLLDLFDQFTSPPKDFILDLREGMKEITITLPQPLVTVPGGTEVNWVTINGPADAHRLLVAAHAPSVPVYGPGSQILALWYRPAPDRLVLFNAVDGSKPKTLTLRNAKLLLQNQDGTRYSNASARLAPLMPVTMRELNANPNATPARNTMPEVTWTNLTATTGKVRMNLWPGTYLLSFDSGNRPRFQTVEIPEIGTDPVVVKYDAAQYAGGNGYIPSRSLRLKFPKADYEAMRKVNSQLSYFTDNNLNQRQSLYTGYLTREESSISVPADAHTVTFYWPGAGLIRSIAIPEGGGNNETPLITLPDWDAGAVVTGMVLMPDGKPYARQSLTSGTNLASYNNQVRLQTDENGKFTLKGVLPGMLCLTSEGGVRQGSWVLQVPEKGLTDVILRMAENPVRLNLNTLIYGSLNTYFSSGEGAAALWWFPDGAKPVVLPLRSYYESTYHDFASGSGALWAVDNTNGCAVYARVSISPGNNDFRPAPTMPSLGIYFPLDLVAGLPGAVTVAGLDNLDGVVATFPTFNWQANIILKRYVGQIYALPPGKYKVTVNTARGKVESTATIGEFGGCLELTFPATK